MPFFQFKLFPLSIGCPISVGFFLFQSCF
jgi:hypothetical protein